MQIIILSSIICTGYAVVRDLPARALSPTTYDIVSTIEQPARGEFEPLYTLSAATNTTLINSVTLALSAHSLQPAQSYRFRLQATDSMDRVGFAEIDIHTESLPLFGWLDVMPQTGDSLSTLFRLSAFGWTDDVGDAPLSYQYGFQFDDDEETVHWLTGVLSRDHITTLLPPASQGGLSVVLSVSDRNGAVARRKVQVSLNAETGMNERMRLSTILEEIESKAINFGNWVEGLADLMAVAVAINENEYFMYSSEDAMKVRMKGVELITSLYWSQIPASKVFLDQLLSLLSELTKDAAFSDLAISELVSTLDSIILQYINMEQSPTTVFRPGFSEWALQTILNIYANLIAANSIVGDAGRIQEDTLTKSLTHNIPSLGHGACLQLGLRERQVTAVAPGLGTLSISLSSLPSAYMTIQASNCSDCSLSEVAPTVSVDFGRHLYE